MSTPTAWRWDLVRNRPARQPIRPSLREVCLVGSADRPDSAPEPPRQTLRRSGRTYRVASATEPIESDPRRYLHLVVAPEFARA
jgi:hypothetical protein